MELIISDSIERREMVELSWQNGKSYIGYAIESGITKPSTGGVALTPVASGYRSAETRELHITNHYSHVIQKWCRNEASDADIIRDFRIVISREEICSASIRLCT